MEISAKQWWHDELSGLKHLAGQHDQQSHGRGDSKPQAVNNPSQNMAAYVKASQLNFYDFDNEGDKKEAFDSIKSTYDDLVERFPILAEMPPLKRLNIVDKRDFGQVISSYLEFNRNVYAYGKPEGPLELEYTEGMHSRYMDDSVISIAKGGAGYSWNQESKLQLGGANVAESPKDIFRHEFGHYFVFTRDQKAIDKVNDLLEGANQFTFSPFRISAYAATSSHELLAESFAAYTHPKYKHGQLPKQIEGLLDDLLGKSKTKVFGLQMFKHLRDQHDQQSHAGVPSNFSETKFVNDQRVMSDGSLLPEYLSQNKVRIPPAWTEVIVSRDPGNGLWVKGHDAKGRHQSVYSSDFIKQNAQAKFVRVLEAAKKFDRINKENTDNMKSKDPEIREAASVMKLIMATGIRPGSEKDTGAEKKAYGATTLEGRHVVKDKDGVRLEFVGKKGVNLSIPIANKEVADMVFQRAKSAGKDGKLFNVDDGKLRDYTHTLDGGKFKTKDFRTLLATKTAIDKINEFGDRKPKDQKEYKKMVKEVATVVSAKLGNTPAIALQSYISPIVFKGWQGSFAVSGIKIYGLQRFIKHLAGTDHDHDQSSHGGEGGIRNKTDEELTQAVHNERLLQTIYGYDAKDINFNGMTALDRLKFDEINAKIKPEFAFTEETWNIRDGIPKGLPADKLREILREKGKIAELETNTPSSKIPKIDFVISNIHKGLSEADKEAFIDEYPKHLQRLEGEGLKTLIEFYPNKDDGFTVSQYEKLSDNLDKTAGRSGLKLKNGDLDYANKIDAARVRFGAFSKDKDVALHRLLSSWAMMGGGTSEQKMLRETSNQVFPVNQQGIFYNGVRNQRDEAPFYSKDRVKGHLESLKKETEDFYKKKFASKKDPNPDLSSKMIEVYRGVGGHLQDGYRPAAIESWTTQKSTANKFGKMMEQFPDRARGGKYGKTGYYSLLSANVSYDHVLWSYESVKGKYGWPPESELKGKKEFVIIGGVFKDNLINMEKLYD